MTESYASTDQEGDRPEWVSTPEREGVDVLDSQFTKEEVVFQMRRLPTRSAPGPDQLTNQNWRSLDSKAELLSLIFNLCREARRIPDSWKSSITVLAYKDRGDKSDLSSWRPICLQNTLYKIYAACIAERIANWALEMDAINKAQKGFLLFEGCFEHNFLLQKKAQEDTLSDQCQLPIF